MKKTPAGKSPPQAAVDPASTRTTFDFVRENVEALVVAVILAIIIRHFAVEAFEIPTGSMAPALFGMHAWIACPNCATDFNIAVRTDTSSGQIEERNYSEYVVARGHGPAAAPSGAPRCSVDLHVSGPDGMPLRPGAVVECSACKQRFRGDAGSYASERVMVKEVRCPHCDLFWRAVVDRSNVYGGNKILVNKFAYVFTRPRRFDVIVFAFDQWKNYIKRLVGLPGELIDIFDGDVYVNGKIVRKTDDPTAQEVMWRKVSDSTLAEAGLNPVPAWKDAGANGGRAWEHLPDLSWSLNCAGADRPAVLEYRRSFDNYTSYNATYFGAQSTPRGNGTRVGDRKMAFTVVPVSQGGWIGAEIRDGEFSFQIRAPVGKASAENPAVIERKVNEPEGGAADPERSGHSSALAQEGAHPGPLRAVAAAALTVGQRSRIEIENVDDRVTARFETPGQPAVVLTFDYVSCPDPTRPPAEGGSLPQSLRLLGKNVRASFEAIQVYQDNYYSREGHIRLPYQLEADQYLALGDNSASSSDGRYWGFVPARSLMGKALLVLWPALPGNFQCKFIR